MITTILQLNGPILTPRVVSSNSVLRQNTKETFPPAAEALEMLGLGKLYILPNNGPPSYVFVKNHPEKVAETLSRCNLCNIITYKENYWKPISKLITPAVLQRLKEMEAMPDGFL